MVAALVACAAVTFANNYFDLSMTAEADYLIRDDPNVEFADALSLATNQLFAQVQHHMCCSLRTSDYTI